MKNWLPGILIFIVAAYTPCAYADTLAPVLTKKLDSVASGVAWLDADRVLIASPTGVRIFSFRDGKMSTVISTAAMPNGLPDPMSVATDGHSILASNGFERAHFAARADTGQRIFARTSPLFEVIDLAVSGNKIYALGWPADSQGANNPDGFAVWQGTFSSKFDKYLPLHRIQSGTASVNIFNDSLPIYGGALAIEKDGTLDVITAAEPGIFQYSPDGTLKGRLGAQLGDLVMRRMHDINFTYGSDPAARYREVVNRQPTIDDLVATADGPAIVVRTARNDSIEWELWYPNASRTGRRLKLGISRLGPFGHLSCNARERDLVCVYQTPETAQAAATMDQSKIPSYLVEFKLPSFRTKAAQTANK